MASTPPTQNMGLNIWSQATDVYNHSELANNFVQIDIHDHSPGRGNQIPSSGLEDSAVTTNKISDGAVTPSKIPDHSIGQIKLENNSVGTDQLINGSVTTDKIADKAVTGAKLADGLLPLGSVLAWYRASIDIAIPNGWIIPVGQQWSTTANDMGLTSGSVPDLRNRFILGASTTGTGADPSSPPSPGSTGGNNTASLSHAHTVPDHAHTVPDHAHGINVQAPHAHRFFSKNYDGAGNETGTFLTQIYQRTVGVASSAGVRQAAFIPNLNINSTETTDGGVPSPLGPDEYPAGVQHNHGGATAGSGAFGTSSVGLTTGSSLGSVDVRPNFIGLLYIMKVKI